jgi:hypothetical protein
MSIQQFFDMNADLREMQENQAFNLDQVVIWAISDAKVCDML